MKTNKSNIGILGLFLGLTLLILACKDGSVTPWLPSEPNKDLYSYFPCSPGDYWIYEYRDNMYIDTLILDTITVTVTANNKTDTTNIAQFTHQWKNFAFTLIELIAFEKDTIYRKLYLNNELLGLDDSIKTDDSLRNMIRRGFYMILPLKETHWKTKSIYMSGIYSYYFSDSISVEKVDSLNVPLKTFKNVYRLKAFLYSSLDDFYIEIYYAPYIGIIKESFVQNGSENWSKSLISYNVKKIN